MVRIEVETIVWSSAASSMPTINPIRIVRICRWDSLSGVDEGAVPAPVDDVALIRPLLRVWSASNGLVPPSCVCAVLRGRR